MDNSAEPLLQRQTQTDEALALAHCAAWHQPELPAGLNAWAAAPARARQYDRPAPLQQRAVWLMPAEPTLRLHLAGYLLALGEKACTREQMERALHTGLPPTRRNEAQRLRRQLGA